MPYAGGSASNQRECERGSFAKAALNADLPTLSFHQTLHQRKPQPLPLRLVADAHKPAEYCREILFSYSIACITHAEVDPSDVLGGLDRYAAATSGMTYRIRNKVIEDGRDRPAVSHDPRQVRPDLVLELDSLALCNRTKSLNRAARQLNWSQSFERESSRSGFYLGELKQVANQLIQFVSVRARAFQQLVLLFIQLAGVSLGDRVKRKLERAQWLAKLARRNRDELRLEFVHLSDRGYIFEQGYRADQSSLRIAHRRCAQTEVALRSAQLEGHNRSIIFSGDRSLH